MGEVPWFMYVAAMRSLAVAPVVASSTFRYDLPIANLVSLFNVQVYMQAVAYAPGYSGLELITSNGIDLIIGNY